MDPTRIFCRVDVNVTPEYSRQIILNNILPFSFSGTPGLAKSNNKRMTKDNKNIDDKFQLLSLSPFNQVSAYELSSLDMYFNLTTHDSGTLAPQLLKAQTYVITSNDIGYMNYLQYRNPLTFIYLFDNISYSEIKDTFIVYERVKQIGSSRELPIDFYTEQVLRTSYDGIDVFLLTKYNSIEQLITLIIVMLKVLKTNGTCVIKLNSIQDDIVQLMTYTFDHIFLFKSAVSNINDSEYHLICKFYNKNKSMRIITFLLDILGNSSTGNLLFDINPDVYNYVDKVIQMVSVEVKDNPVYIPTKLKMYLNIT